MVSAMTGERHLDHYMKPLCSQAPCHCHALVDCHKHMVDRRVAGDSDDEEEELAPLRRAQALIRRLRRRDLYKYCQEVTLPSKCADNCFVMPTAGGERAATLYAKTLSQTLCQTLTEYPE